MHTRRWAWISLLLVLATPVAADVPMLLNYQGRLTDPSGAPKNGTFTMTFALFDAETGGSQLPAGTPWAETQSVQVANGTFNVLLGNVTPLPPTLFTGGPSDAAGPLRFLEVTVNGETLSPRRRIASAAYAIGAAGAASIWAEPNTRSIDLEASSFQFLSAVDSASLSVTSNLTLECWVKLETVPGGGIDCFALINKWLSNSPGTNERSYLLAYCDTSGVKSLRFDTSNDGSSIASASVAAIMTPGVWSHVAVVYDASAGSAEFFLNGYSIGSSAGLHTDLFDSNALLRIGALTSGGSNHFDGLIDEARVWAAKRSPEQVRDHFACQLTGAEADLRAYYRLNGDLLDSTGNGNTLTNNGGAAFSLDVPFLVSPCAGP